MPTLSTIVAEHPDLLTTIVCALARDVGGTSMPPHPPTRLDVMQLPPVLQPATMQDLHSILGGMGPASLQGLQNVLGGAPPPNMSMAPMNPLMPNNIREELAWKNWN